MNKESTRWFSATLILLALVGLNFLLFRIIGGVNYFLWYLKNGALISIAVSFVALIWEGLKWREDLLSSHPREYLRGCAGLGANFFSSIAAHLTPGKKTSNSRTYSTVAMLWDNVIGLLLIILMMVFAICWLLVIAPLNYFITLITGSVERQALHGSPAHAIEITEGKNIILTSLPATAELPGNAVNISLTRKPFAITQALTALLLWSANLLYESLK
jgi:hypothetical protein